MEAIGLVETDIPEELRASTRKWWISQMQQLEQAHGERWPDNRDWLIDYMNADLRHRLTQRKPT